MSAPLTFLFTDVEGSTRTWEAHPKAMPQALSKHFRLLKQAIEGEGGSIVTETGDGVFAVFPSPLPAVNAATSAQQALAAATWGATGPLKVRMGVHTGTATREHDDYHGTDVNRTARLMATAHGGQLVASEVTYSLVRDHAPEGVEFVDLGEHRLNDLARPERIYQVSHPSLPTEFDEHRRGDRDWPRSRRPVCRNAGERPCPSAVTRRCAPTAHRGPKRNARQACMGR